MFNDRTAIWVLEYIFGGALVVIPLTSLSLWQPGWMDVRIWAAQLFVVCLGVVLVSCASSMRQRMLLSRHLDNLAEQIAAGSTSLQQSSATEGPKENRIE